MARLNYRHLEYFWHVAREGGVTAASRGGAREVSSAGAGMSAGRRVSVGEGMPAGACLDAEGRCGQVTPGS